MTHVSKKIQPDLRHRLEFVLEERHCQFLDFLQVVDNGSHPVGQIRFPTMLVSMTALLNMSQLTGIEHLLQDIDSLEGHHLHGVL